MLNFRKILNFFKNSAGFSLVESLVVLCIMAILLAVFIFNYNEAKKQLALQRAANKLSQDIRRVEGMAGLSEERCKTGGVFPNDYEYGYGVFFDKNVKYQYILFADCDGDKEKSSGDIGIETINFERVDISDTELVIDNSGGEPKYPTQLSIVFTPPDPTLDFDGEPQGWKGISSSVKISLDSDPNSYRIIAVNKIGLIEIQ